MNEETCNKKVIWDRVEKTDDLLVTEVKGKHQFCHLSCNPLMVHGKRHYFSAFPLYRNMGVASWATFIFYPTLLNNCAFRAHVLYPLAIQHSLFVSLSELLGVKRDRAQVSRTEITILWRLSWDNTRSFPTFTASLLNRDLKGSALGTQGNHLVLRLDDEIRK